jgi:hypothetical protein
MKIEVNLPQNSPVSSVIKICSAVLELLLHTYWQPDGQMDKEILIGDP